MELSHRDVIHTIRCLNIAEAICIRQKGRWECNCSHGRIPKATLHAHTISNMLNWAVSVSSLPAHWLTAAVQVWCTARMKNYTPACWQRGDEESREVRRASKGRREPGRRKGQSRAREQSQEPAWRLDGLGSVLKQMYDSETQGWEM